MVGSSGGTGVGGGAAAGGGSGSAGAAPGAASAQARADGPTLKAGEVEVLSADDKSQGIFNGQGKPTPTSISFEQSGAAKGVDVPAKNQGIRLESLGKGISAADVDEKTSQVVVRRSGRVVERFEDEKAIVEFVEKKKLSALDRETLLKLNAVREADPAARAEAKRGLGPNAPAREPELANSVAASSEKGLLRAEIERNDAETYTWVEKQRKARLERVEPIETDVIAAAAAKATETKSGDTIEREALFASPNARIKVVPSEIGSQFNQVGDKYFHQNNTKSVAFVDRGDKLETPSSAPQMAQSLVKIAEARGWDELKVRGTEGFRREVWLEASVRGIHVDGYKPSELDKVELEKRNTFMQDRNSVEVRSEAFQKLSPEDGVRRDPTLATAYGTEAAAKRLAERIHPESRDAFVKSVKEAVTHKLESGEPVAIKLKVPEGQLIEYGKANYKFDKDERPSYYVKLAEANGRERIYWGTGLQKAMGLIDAQPGDMVQLRVTESKSVVVEGNVRDAPGQVVGRQTVDSHRNEWQATVTAKARSKTRKEPQPEQDRVR